MKANANVSPAGTGRDEAMQFNYQIRARKTSVYTHAADRKNKKSELMPELTRKVDDVRVPCKIAGIGERWHLVPAAKVVVADPINAKNAFVNKALIKGCFVLIQRHEDVEVNVQIK